MTSSNSNSPTELHSTELDERIKNDSRSASPISFYGSSPERVTKQNQLLQPVLLLNIPSRASSEVNLADREERDSMNSFSKSENAFAQEEEVSQEDAHLKESHGKRIGWVKLIRLQLNALHEKKAKTAAGDNKQQESDVPDASRIKEEIWPNLLKEPSQPPEALQRMSVPWLVVNDNRAPTLSDLDLKNLNTSGNLKKKTTNVKGKLSSFWRQAAAAALRHQKQSEELANQKSHSSSPTSSGMDTEEAAIQRTLSNLFQISWPTYQQVSCWQHSFQNLLQDEHGILVFREFLQGEFSDENLEFWIACQKYKNLTDVSLQKRRAQEIYDGFIAFQSQREVNLDCETRIQTEARLAQAELDLFDASQKRIEALMEKDPYRRFLRSDLFIKLLDKCQKLENTNPNSPEDNPDNSNSVILTDHVPESTTADEVSPKARRVKTKPSQSIDLGDLRVVSVKLTKS